MTDSRSRRRYTLARCLDIFDWFDDAAFDYISHILWTKVNGEERVANALPELRKRAQWLVKVHEGTEMQYDGWNLVPNL